MEHLGLMDGRTDAISATLERVAEVDQALAARAAAALAVLLTGVRGSCWPEVAWQFSRLGAGGCPVELSFSSAGLGLRYTVEPAGPELAPADRLAAALRHLELLAPGRPVPAELLGHLGGTWPAAGPSWGAWVGGRHSATRSGFKLYAEVPASRVGQVQDRYLGPGGVLAGRPVRLEGLGYDLTSGRVELYYRAHRLNLDELGLLLYRARLPDRRADLEAMLAEVLGRPAGANLPLVRFGFSLTDDPAGRGGALSVFCYSYEALGDDARCRERVLGLADRHGWDAVLYRHVSAPLVATPTGSPGRHRHTVVAVTVAAAGPPAVTIALSPPDPGAPG